MGQTRARRRRACVNQSCFGLIDGATNANESVRVIDVRHHACYHTLKGAAPSDVKKGGSWRDTRTGGTLTMTIFPVLLFLSNRRRTPDVLCLFTLSIPIIHRTPMTPSDVCRYMLKGKLPFRDVLTHQYPSQSTRLPSFPFCTPYCAPHAQSLRFLRPHLPCRVRT